MTAKSLIKIVSVSEMVEIEKQADKGGITYRIMMQNAGVGLAKVIEKKYQHIENKQLVAFVGKGNNGGDALVALDALNQSGWQTNAYIVGERNSKDALIQKAVNSGSELIWHKDDPSFEQIDKCLENTQFWLDGLLGTGIKLPLRPPISNLLDHLSDILAMYEKKPALIAIDCPSGIDCDTGEVADQTLPADLTVCMEAVKQGMLKFPAFEYLGELQVVSIGLPAELGLSDHIDNFLIDQIYVNSHLPERPRTAHKGTFGKVLVIAGSANFPGAALLAGRAAFRVGAGWVAIASPKSVYELIAGQFPEATWRPLPEEDGGIAESANEELTPELARTTAILLGPGIGLRQPTKKFIEKFLSPTLAPLVIDADGLKLLAEIHNWPNILPINSILTPHPGEMSILSDIPIQEIQADRVNIAQRCAKKWSQIIILKGAVTIVAHPDGKVGILPIATPALARAGTGDVLAGVITGLVAQGMDPFEAACAGVWLHAHAGLLAANQAGSTAGVLAGDLVDQIPKLLPY